MTRVGSLYPEPVADTVPPRRRRLAESGTCVLIFSLSLRKQSAVLQHQLLFRFWCRVQPPLCGERKRLNGLEFFVREQGPVDLLDNLDRLIRVRPQQSHGRRRL